ncbi:dihydrolipoyllysine-residue acetyltransferase [Aliikangiella sp. IMCC44359]|uniref:dihydrolipoyllysine-residue acetyltransferase n=1 Tax=Aliikangiella sp. IMCC44359 TaxID=3459125 RepID=UPI00403AD63E
MSNLVPVNVPDIGDVSDVDVIEVLVAVGDTIAKEDALITLETDKATMDVPASEAGTIKAIHVRVGDKVSQGSLILELEASQEETPVEVEAKKPENTQTQAATNAEPAQDEIVEEYVEEAVTESEEKALVVPDIGDASDVDVIEVLVADGDQVTKDQGLIVLETDKATMEVPAPEAGTILSITVKVGDKVSQGDTIGRINSQTTVKSSVPDQPAKSASTAVSAPVVSTQAASSAKRAPVPEHPQMKKRVSGSVVHASPSVRRFARELGADLTKVSGSGPKGRVLKEDVQNYIKFELSRPKATAATGAFSTPQMPSVDHAKWGNVEEKPLSRIQKISSVNLHRNWISIPHVTQHEDADITELDEFRKSLKDEAMKDGVRLTPLAFIMKGLVHTLKAFPKFNASLANDGENLILKNYYHIGVAVETPDGLTVPVIRDVDQKGIYQLASELGEISAKAREKKLSADDMQGSSFTISSLGGIGGTAFTPIVKWPDVAILGLSRNKMQPVWNGKEFVPRLMLPMSLSYDHRVIDGADAARFVVHLSQTLNDIRRVLLK